MLISPLGLLRVLEDLEHYARSTGDETALNAVLDCTSSLQKLVVKMDSLEEGFDKIAERSCSSSIALLALLLINLGDSALCF